MSERANGVRSKATGKIGLLALVAATYSMVAGGPFGLEEIVGRNGYHAAVVILCVTPLLWAVPTALMVSELASALPQTGGSYVWVRRALGPFWGFQESWLTFAGSVFDMALYPILFSSYLSHLVPSLGRGHLPLVIGAAMITVCVAMNLLGTEIVGDSSIVFVLLLLAPFVMLCWLGVRSSAHASAAQLVSHPDIAGGILIAMWNYMGWDNASTIAGDVRHATRTYSRAMFISVLAVVLTYIVPIQALAHSAIPPSAWETGSWVNIAGLLGGRPLQLFMTAAALLAAFSTFNALVLSLTRLPYAMARDGYLPRALAVENRRGAPWLAIIICSITWGLAMSLGFERTVLLDVMLTGLSIVLEFAALIALRIREPELHRPFRIKGGLPSLALLATPPCVLIVVSCIRSRHEAVGPMNAFALGLVLIALGIVSYVWSTKRSSQLRTVRNCQES